MIKCKLGIKDDLPYITLAFKKRGRKIGYFGVARLYSYFFSTFLDTSS